MIKVKFLLIITFNIFIQNSWAISVSSQSFTLFAGTKKISFPKSPGIKWSDFCFDKKMGCARFQVQDNENYNFGFVKIVSDKIEINDFKKYCSEVFELSRSIDKNLNNFVNAGESAVPHCSWLGLKDITQFFWKDGLTIVVTTSGKIDAQRIISEAKTE